MYSICQTKPGDNMVQDPMQSRYGSVTNAYIDHLISQHDMKVFVVFHQTKNASCNVRKYQNGVVTV